eukprot:925467-Rhodomonas_salina.1
MATPSSQPSGLLCPPPRFVSVPDMRHASSQCRTCATLSGSAGHAPPRHALARPHIAARELIAARSPPRDCHT